MEQGSTGHYTEKRRLIELCKIQNHFFDTSYEQSFWNVLLNRLHSQTEVFLAEMQAGFRTGRSTMQQILSVHLIAEK